VSLPVDAAQLAGFDVVIVLHGAVLDETRRAALQHYVMQYGGGVLIATRDPLLQRLGLAEGAQPDARSVGASSVIWSLPPELTPLPAGDEVSAAEPLVAAAAAFTAAADAQGSALLVLRSAGHGRAAALGLRESWHWRVAGGRIDEHREFWRSLVDWLAPRPPVPHVDVPYTIVETGLPVQVDVDAGTPLPPLRLRRPDGAAEPLPRSVGTADRAYYRFLPADTGLHAVLLPGDSVLAAVRALAAGSRAARTARAPMAGAAAADHAAAGAAASSAEAGALLALLADASGGRAMPGSELEAAVRTYSAAPPVPVQWRIPLLLLRRELRRRARQPQPQPGIATREQRVTGLSDNETMGLGVRVLADGAWGFAATRELTAAAVDRAAAPRWRRRGRTARAAAARSSSRRSSACPTAAGARRPRSTRSTSRSRRRWSCCWRRTAPRSGCRARAS
jgi:hypothetical protein